MTQAADMPLIVDLRTGISPYYVTADDSYSSLTVGDISTGILLQTSGMLTILGAVTIGNTTGSNGTFNLVGGTLLANDFYSGYNGSGTFEQNSGTVTLGGSAYIGNAASGSGTYNLSGGTLLANNIYSGYGGSGNFVQSGDSVVATNTSKSFAVVLGNNAGSVGKYTISGTATLSMNSLMVGNQSAGDNVFTQNGGTATATGFTTVGNSAGSKGTFNLNGGTYTGAIILIGSVGTGTVNQTGGVLNGTVFGLRLGSGTNGVGAYNLSGGTLAAVSIDCGLNGIGTFTQSGSSRVTTLTGKTLNITLGTNAGTPGTNLGSEGTYTISDTASISATVLNVGYNSVRLSIFNLNGGTVALTSSATLAYGTTSQGTLNLAGGTFSAPLLIDGNVGTGIINQTAGICTVSSQLTVGNSANSRGTYNLNGGTLATPLVQRNGGTGTFNFNGGTLQATASSASFMNSLTAANVQAGGAVIGTNGFNVTVGQALLHDPTLLTADGGLAKRGPGSLTLTGANTFTGATVIHNGTLTLNNASGALAATGAVTVNAGGTLLLGAANQIKDIAPLTLDAASGPGTGAAVAFRTGGFSETLGALTLSSTSVIDLGAGASILHFADSSQQAWTGTLAIWNWTGNAITGGGTDQLIFGNTVLASLTPAQLLQISFYSDSGATYLGFGGYATSLTGEIVPVPEPATWLGGALLALVAVHALRRRA